MCEVGSKFGKFWTQSNKLRVCVHMHSVLEL
jgi:hypothetical protein